MDNLPINEWPKQSQSIQPKFLEVLYIVWFIFFLNFEAKWTLSQISLPDLSLLKTDYDSGVRYSYFSFVFYRDGIIMLSA